MIAIKVATSENCDKEIHLISQCIIKLNKRINY